MVACLSPTAEKSAVVALLVLNGSHAGSRFRLPDVPTVLGRSAEAHYRLDDPWISNMHALFETRDQVLWVVDLDSRNGTFVGASRVHEAPLAVGAVLAFGRTEVRVEDGAASTTSSPTPSPLPFLIDAIRTTVRSERPDSPLDLKPRPMAVLRLSLTAPASRNGLATARALQAAAQAIMREGGRTTPHLATDLMAVFGHGGPPPDDAARALRAAGAIRRELMAAHPSLGVRLAVDFGPVSSGIINSSEGAELVAGGETTDRLEQVLAKAKTGEILAGPGVPAGTDDRLEPISRGASDLLLRRLRVG
jgi:hypothetical protein